MLIINIIILQVAQHLFKASSHWHFFFLAKIVLHFCWEEKIFKSNNLLITLGIIGTVKNFHTKNKTSHIITNKRSELMSKDVCPETTEKVNNVSNTSSQTKGPQKLLWQNVTLIYRCVLYTSYIQYKINPYNQNLKHTRILQKTFRSVVSQKFCHFNFIIHTICISPLGGAKNRTVSQSMNYIHHFLKNLWTPNTVPSSLADFISNLLFKFMDFTSLCQGSFRFVWKGCLVHSSEHAECSSTWLVFSGILILEAFPKLMDDKGKKNNQAKNLVVFLQWHSQDILHLYRYKSFSSSPKHWFNSYCVSLPQVYGLIYSLYVTADIF